MPQQGISEAVLPGCQSRVDFGKGLVSMLVAEAHDEILRGLPLGLVIRETSGFDRAEVARLLAVSEKALERWMMTPRKRLSLASAGGFCRLMRAIRIASELFGGRESAATWLREEQPALGFRKPVTLLETFPGSLCVEQLLDTIRCNAYMS